MPGSPQRRSRTTSPSLPYDVHAVETRWQHSWDNHGCFRAPASPALSFEPYSGIVARERASQGLDGFGCQVCAAFEHRAVDRCDPGEALLPKQECHDVAVAHDGLGRLAHYFWVQERHRTVASVATPRTHPDLTLSGSLEHSQGDYRSDNEKSTERAWDIVAELDFSKFWPEVLDSENEGLDLVFKIEGDTAYEKSNGKAQENSNLDFFVGFTMSISLGE